MSTRPITKLLVANRGEIACRVMRSARRMGIDTVAVFSNPDAQAMHVKFADEALGLGGTTSAESYLRGDAVIQAALDSGAQAIHPGYGFLSENADFADAVTKAGLTFVGPPGQSMVRPRCTRAAGCLPRPTSRAAPAARVLSPPPPPQTTGSPPRPRFPRLPPDCSATWAPRTRPRS